MSANSMEIFSIIVYPAVLLLPFVLYGMAPAVWSRHKFLFHLAAYVPITLMASARGTVGTDTANYREAFELFDVSQYSPLTIDPIFSALFALAKVLGLDFNGFALMHAFLCLFFYSYGASKVDKEVPLFGLLLMPVLFFDATFNGLRYGLAFAIAIVSLHFFQRSTSHLRFGYLLPPIAAHSSLSILLFLVPGLLIAVVPFLLLVNIQDMMYFAYFAGKSDAYSDFSRPGVFSGFMPVLQFFILMLINKVNGVKFRIGINLQSLGMVVFLIGLAASSVSYAGLRILQIAVFVMTVFAAQNVNIDKRRTTMALAILAGLLGIANFLRQIFFVGVEGGVNFYPYNFY